MSPHAPPTPRRRGEELLKRVCNVDAARPAVDLEDAATVGQLYRLLLGQV
jgi:hypothetical protein